MGRLDWALRAMLVLAVVPLGGGVCDGDSREACSSAEDCPVGTTCQSGRCDSGCASNAECPWPGYDCAFQNCVLVRADCTTSAECEPGMVCLDGSCGPPPAECRSDVACGADLVCRDGMCVPPEADTVDLTVTWTVDGEPASDGCPPGADLAITMPGAPEPMVVPCAAGSLELPDVPVGHLTLVSTLSGSFSGSTFEWDPVVTDATLEASSDAVELELVAGRILAVSWTVNGSTMNCPRDPGSGTLFGRGLVVATSPSGTNLISEPQDCPNGMIGAAIALPVGTYSVSVEIEDPWHPSIPVNAIVDPAWVVTDATPWYSTASVDVVCRCCPNPPAGMSCR